MVLYVIETNKFSKLRNFKIQDVSKLLQPINMITIYYREKHNGGYLEHVP